MNPSARVRRKFILLSEMLNPFSSKIKKKEVSWKYFLLHSILNPLQTYSTWSYKIHLWFRNVRTDCHLILFTLRVHYIYIFWEQNQFLDLDFPFNSLFFLMSLRCSALTLALTCPGLLPKADPNICCLQLGCLRWHEPYNLSRLDKPLTVLIFLLSSKLCCSY